MLQTGRQRLNGHRGPKVVVVVAVLLAVAIVVTALRTNDRPKRGSLPFPRTTSSTGRGTSTVPALTTATPSVPRYSQANPSTAMQRAVLARRVGFGGEVTGGAGGAEVMVTSSADSGPGSLREAVRGNSPRWIEFSRDMTIKLLTPLEIGSNKTIDGVGRSVEITGPNIQGFDIIGVSNVIIESITMRDFGNVDLTSRNNLPDAVHIERSHGVWIDHCDLSMAGDKLIGITTGSSGISVTWTHFHDQEQTFQIGNAATAAQDVEQDVTVADNFFDHTYFRNPVVDYGRAHVFNNYYLDWKLYGVRSERTAQMYLENNVFKAGANPRAAVVSPFANGCNDAGTLCDDRLGVIYATGNLLLDGAKIKDGGQPDTTVFQPEVYYHYDAKPATISLANAIAANAGPIL